MRSLDKEFEKMSLVEKWRYLNKKIKEVDERVKEIEEKWKRGLKSIGQKD